MGSYLAKPIFEPESASGQGRGIAFGASCVQGWRATQEDAHNCIIEFDTDQNCSLFAVYDGHGGSEVSKYCSLRLPDFIKSLSSYQAGDFKQALIDAFVKFDETLTKPAALEALKQLAQYESSDDEADDDGDEKGYSETTRLNEEAEMPLEDVLKNYYNKKAEKPEEKDGDSTNQSDGAVPEGEEIKPESNGKTCSSGNVVKLSIKTKDLKGHPDNPNDEGESQKKGATSEEIATAPSSSAGQSAVANTNGNRTKRVAAQKAENIRISQNGDHVDEDEDETDESGEEEDEEEEDENEEAHDCDEEEADDSDEDEEEEDEEEDEADPGENEDYEALDSDIPGSGSGTTAVVALLKDNVLTVANAGDSRAVVCRNGKAIDMSIDHKPEDAKERDRIEKAGGKVTIDGRVNGGLNLSRALGDHVYKQNTKLPLIDQMISPSPDVQTLVIDPETDEFMVLACDGIWNCMTSQEVCDFVAACLRQNDKLSDICVQLFRRCIAPDTSGDGTGCDNMTCIVVQLNAKDTQKRALEEVKKAEVEQEVKRVKTNDEAK